MFYKYTRTHIVFPSLSAFISKKTTIERKETQIIVRKERIYFKYIPEYYSQFT